MEHAYLLDVGLPATKEAGSEAYTAADGRGRGRDHVATHLLQVGPEVARIRFHVQGPGLVRDQDPTGRIQVGAGHTVVVGEATAGTIFVTAALVLVLALALDRLSLLSLPLQKTTRRQILK